MYSSSGSFAMNATGTLGPAGPSLQKKAVGILIGIA